MRLPRPLLLSLAIVSLLGTCVLSQDTTGAVDNDATTTAAAAAAGTTDTDTDLPAMTTDSPTTSSKKDETTTSTKSSSSKTTSAAKTTASDDDDSSPTDMPTISKDYTIPEITVPSTANAPYMQKSSMPDGTVFIAVGAGLAFCLLTVFAWRGFVAWSLHRSVKRANYQATLSDSKVGLGGPRGGGGGGFYAGAPGSTLSLDHLNAMGRTGTGGNAPHRASSLFFSPTSNAAAGGERRSSYLPPGFYAAGNRNSLAPSNSSQTQFASVSSNSRFTRGRDVSPPGSPLMGPQRGRDRDGVRSGVWDRPANDSESSLNLTPHPSNLKAPSTLLDDLFEGHSAANNGGHGRY